LLAIKIIESLYKQGENVFFDIYGDGILMQELQNYINDNSLEKVVKLHGNQSKETIKSTYETAHFSMLPSKSEGWPKAIVEAMFFGVIPIATSISCVPFMLDYGKRGILIEPELEKAKESINNALQYPDSLKMMSKLASKWSQQYTLDVFEQEIVKLLKNS